MVKQQILTTRGIINACDLLPGDYVYEYNTSKPLEVRHIEVKRDERIFEVKYSDKRIEKIGMNEQVLFGNKIYSLLELNGKMHQYIPMERNVIDYKKLYAPLVPDPYTAGAILAYSDLNEPYISIPYEQRKALDHILHVNGWEVYSDPDAEEMYDVNKIYFCEFGSKERITWEKAFPYTMFMKDFDLSSPIIPDEYRFGSIEDRIKFIRGVFDTGYSPSVTPDTISITMDDDIRIKLTQHILWSLGIMSFIHSNNELFQLDIIGPEQDYAGFFYKIENRARMINTDNVVYKCDPVFNLYIESIFPSYTYRNEVWYYLELEKPQAIYYSDQYLPRVSK